MPVAQTASTIPGGYTPVCGTCGMALCWDISEAEYAEDQDFWDDWRCRDCNPDYAGALQRHRAGKQRQDATVPVRRLLRVEAPHFVAGAIWEKSPAGWRCIEAAPILRWMVGKDRTQIATFLKNKGYSWSWLDAGS